MLLGTLTIYGKLFFYISSQEPRKYIAFRADSDPTKEDIPEELTLLRKKNMESFECPSAYLHFNLYTIFFLFWRVWGLSSNVLLARPKLYH